MISSCPAGLAKLRRHSATSGFTLLEMLIAMTLLGFILALLFGALRLGSRSWDAGELRASNNTHLALLQGFLRRELSQTTPYFWKKKTDASMAFAGEPSRLRMVAPLVAHLGHGGLYLLSFELAESNTGRQLIMRRVIPTAGSTDFSALDQAEKLVLAEQVESLSFAYYGAPDTNTDPAWLERWENVGTPQRLPYLIRLRVTFSNGRRWPDLVVAPLIGLTTGCAWDSAANRCVSG